jgi:hypothetical protein
VVESIAIELFRLSMLGKLEVERLQSAVDPDDIHTETAFLDEPDLRKAFGV